MTIGANPNSLGFFAIFLLVGYNQMLMLLIAGLTLLVGALVVTLIHEGVTVQNAKHQEE